MSLSKYLLKGFCGTLVLAVVAVVVPAYKASAQTSTLAVGDQVYVASGPLNVRSTPSLSGANLGTQATGNTGTIVGGPTVANGYIWWNIDYAQNPSGWSVDTYLAVAATQEIGIPPSVPKNLTATGTTSSTVSLSWSASTDALGVEGYIIYRNKIEIGTSVKATFTDTGLTPDTSYTYAVAAYDITGNTSLPSAGVSATTQNSVVQSSLPSIPTGLTANVISSSQINLSWNPSTEKGGTIAGYYLYRDGVKVAGGPNDLYSDTGLSAGTTYIYTVAAFDSTGNVSGLSAAVEATTMNIKNNNPPSVPTGLAVVGTTMSTVSLSWNPSTDNYGTLAGYIIYRANVAVGKSAVPSFTDTSLVAGTTYGYAVASFDTVGNTSGESVAVNATTQAPKNNPPGIPQNLTVIGTTTSTVNLAWSPSSAGTLPVAGYIIYRNKVQVGTSVNTLFSDTGLTPATTYSYTVAAYDAVSDTSLPSSAVSATTQAVKNLIPPTVSISSPADGANVSGAINVQVVASDNSGITKVEFYVNNVLQTSTTTPPYSFPWNTASLANGAYTLSAKAYDPAGNIGISSNVTVNVSNSTSNGPSVPQNLAVTATTASSISLSWSPSTETGGTVVGYEIYRGTLLVGTVAGTSYTDTGLAAATSYTYTVEALDSKGKTSAPSASVTAKTQSVATSGTALINAAFAPLGGSSQKAFLTYIAPSPWIDGYDPHLDWSQVDEGPGATGGEYQWNTYDSEIAPLLAAAKEYGKKVNIIVYEIGTGGDQSTPSYLLNSSSVQKVTCEVDSQSQTIPIVYDAPFTTAYKAFMTQVLAHYANNPYIGYIRFGLSVNGEIFPWCVTEEAAIAGLSVKDWDTQVWLPYDKAMLDYEKSQDPTMTIVAPTTQSGNPDMTDTEGPNGIADGFGFGNQGLQKTDITNAPSKCTGDWCNLFSTYYTAGLPLELQTVGQSDAAGTLNDGSQQAETGPLPQLISLGLKYHANVFEVYTDDLMLALDPTYCNNLNQCNSQYGTAYVNALKLAHGQ